MNEVQRNGLDLVSQFFSSIQKYSKHILPLAIARKCWVFSLGASHHKTKLPPLIKLEHYLFTTMNFIFNTSVSSDESNDVWKYITESRLSDSEIQEHKQRMKKMEDQSKTTRQAGAELNTRASYWIVEPMQKPKAIPKKRRGEKKMRLEKRCKSETRTVRNTEAAAEQTAVAIPALPPIEPSSKCAICHDPHDINKLVACAKGCSCTVCHACLVRGFSRPGMFVNGQWQYYDAARCPQCRGEEAFSLDDNDEAIVDRGVEETYRFEVASVGASYASTSHEEGDPEYELSSDEGRGGRRRLLTGKFEQDFNC